MEIKMFEIHDPKFRVADMETYWTLIRFLIDMHQELCTDYPEDDILAVYPIYEA